PRRAAARAHRVPGRVGAPGPLPGLVPDEVRRRGGEGQLVLREVGPQAHDGRLRATGGRRRRMRTVRSVLGAVVLVIGVAAGAAAQTGTRFDIQIERDTRPRTSILT